MTPKDYFFAGIVACFGVLLLVMGIQETLSRRRLKPPLSLCKRAMRPELPDATCTREGGHTGPHSCKYFKCDFWWEEE